jgi:hypothetical protein
MPTTRRATLALTAALTALALAGCGDDDPVKSAQDAANGAADKAQQKAYEGATIAALAAIDPDLAKNPSRALVQAKAVCYAIENENAARAATVARQQFGSSSVKVNDATAKQIIKVLKKDLCPRL